MLFILGHSVMIHGWNRLMLHRAVGIAVAVGIDVVIHIIRRYILAGVPGQPDRHYAAGSHGRITGLRVRFSS